MAAAIAAVGLTSLPFRVLVGSYDHDANGAILATATVRLLVSCVWELISREGAAPRRLPGEG